MRKIAIYLILLLLLPACIYSTVQTVGNSSTLTLVMPEDTLSFGFASDENGTALTDEDKKFYLWAYSRSFAEGGDSELKTSGNPNDSETENVNAVYALSAVTFYVYWNALINGNATLYLEVPQYFEGSNSGKLYVVGDASEKIVDKISGSTVVSTEFADAKYVVSGDNKVADLSRTVSSGATKYALALNVKDAKKGETYTGTVTLKVAST